MRSLGRVATRTSVSTILAAALAQLFCTTILAADTDLTGRATWGDGGALRVIADVESVLMSDPKRRMIAITLFNEGQLELSLRKADRFTAKLEDGSQVPLKLLQSPVEKLDVLVVPPHDMRLVFGELPKGRRGRIVALVLSAAGLSEPLVVGTPCERPEERLVAAPTLPGATVVPEGSHSVATSALLDETGRPTEVFVSLSSSAVPQVLREAAREAMSRSRYDPLKIGGAPTPSLASRTFSFGAERGARAFVPIPPEQLPDLIQAVFTEASLPFVRLDSLSGFAAAGTPDRSGPAVAARAFLLRYGREEPPGTGSWIAVRPVVRVASKRNDLCGCLWSADAPAYFASDFLDWLGPRMHVAAIRRSTVFPVAALVPTGDPEPPEAGRWNMFAVTRLLQHSMDSAEPLPSEPEFLHEVGMAGIEGVGFPEAVHTPRPLYPKDARWAGVQGKVILSAVIDTAGRVTDVRVLSSTPMLDAAAIAAACCRRYRPATMNGRPVPAHTTIVIDFVLS